MHFWFIEIRANSHKGEKPYGGEIYNKVNKVSYSKISLRQRIPYCDHGRHVSYAFLKSSENLKFFRNPLPTPTLPPAPSF